MRRTTKLIALFSLALIITPSTAPAQDPVPKRAVSFDDVVKLITDGKDAPAILDACDTIFTFSVEEREKLSKAGATPALIDALEKKRMSLGDVRNVVIILDCSGSMADLMPNKKTKMEAAQKVMSDLIEAIPAGRNVAFIVYGHDLALKCEAVKVVRQLGQLQQDDKDALIKYVKMLKPTGHTPIAHSLQVAGNELAKAEGLCQVVLITDGEETCKGDPAKEAEKLALRENIRAVEVIGLGLTPKEKESVTNIARRGRGRFYDAQTEKEFEKAVVAAVPVKPQAKVEEKKKEEPKKVVVEPPKKIDIPADLPKAVRNLIEALMDEDVSVRTTTAESLARFKYPAVVAALCESLKDKDGRVRRAAADSLATIGDPAAANALVKRIQDEIWILYPEGSFNYDPKDLPPYDGGGKTWGSKDHALSALKKVAADKVPAALAGALKANKVELRRWAAARMASEKGEAAVTSLADALADADGQVRRAAADSLGKIGDKSEAVIDALIKRVGDSVWSPRPERTISFNPDDPPAYDDHKDWGSKLHALQALKNLAPARVEDALATALRAKSPEVRKWAAREIAGK